MIHRSVLPALTAALLLAGCTQATPPVGPDATSVSGVYTGEYLGCPQGPTALTLTLTGELDGQVSGTFTFSATAGNPGVPTGSYAVSGRLASGQALALTAGVWTDQPAGYSTVDLDGQFDRTFGTYRGRVPQCGTFSVTRRP